MKKLRLRAVSLMLTLLLLMSCVTAGYVPVNAATTNGYDRGYDGGFAGDGKIYCEGLDLSSWQAGAVNFTAIKASGYDYVILRVGTSKMTSKDTCFDEFYESAKAAGLDVGAYFYSYATTTTAVQEDIAKCKEWLAGKTFEYPFYFDYEDSSQADLPTATALNIINTFIDAFVEEGYLMGLYSMKSWMTQSWITSSSLPSTYEGWVAHYVSDSYDGGYEKYGSTYSTQYGMYQYTDDHYFTYNGKTYGPYDANICYKDYPSIVKEYGFNGYEPSGVSAAKESLQETIDLTVDISHRDYTEATINEIRTAYKAAVALVDSDTATKEELDAANTTLKTLLAITGSNTIAHNNEGVAINGRNQKITAGACILYSPTWNDGLITVSNANIAYTVNVVFKWDEELKFNVVKSVSVGTGQDTPDIQLEADEFLLAAHYWEEVEGSAENFNLLSALQVGDRVKLSGATALNAGTDVEVAAYAKFLPKDCVVIHGRNTAITSGQTVLFTTEYNKGLLTAANANIHLSLNVRAKWSNTENAWVIVEKISGDGTTGESSNIELASDEILFAAHYNPDDKASIRNWCYLYDAEIGQKITFSGVSPDAGRTAISCAANISFSDAEYPETEVVSDNIALNKEYVASSYTDSPYTAKLTDDKASTVFQAGVNNSSWFAFKNTGDSSTGNVTNNKGIVTLDLSGQAEISKISVHVVAGSNDVGATQPDYTNIYISSDGEIYTYIKTIDPDWTATEPYWAVYDISSAPVEARYVKFAFGVSEGDLVLLNEIKINGTMLTSEEDVEAGTISTVTLAGSFNSWNSTPNMYNVDENTVSATLTLEAGTHEFKVLYGNEWYGNNGTIVDTTTTTSETGWIMEAGANNCQLSATHSGNYVFTFNKETKALTVVYEPGTLYLCGDFNEWGTDQVMTDNGDGTYSATITLKAGTYEFKVANADGTYNCPSENQTLTLASAADVTFTLDLYGNVVTTTVADLEELVDSDLKVSKAALQLENDISIVFKADASIVDASYVNCYVVIAQEKEDNETEKQTITGVKSSDGNFYEFKYTGVNAKEVGDSLDVTIYAYNAKNQLVTGKVLEDYSVMKYCKSQLSKTDEQLAAIGMSTEQQRAFRTLLVDLVNYASEAQKYFGYKTEALVSDQLTETQKTYASDDSVLDSLENITKVSYVQIENPTATWKSAGLNLLSKTTVRLQFEYSGDISNVTMAAKVNGKAVDAVTEFEALGNNLYYVYFEGMTACEFSVPLDFTIMENGTAISNTLRYSVESYVAGCKDNATVGAVMSAMMKYGKAAASYKTVE